MRIRRLLLKVKGGSVSLTVCKQSGLCFAGNNAVGTTDMRLNGPRWQYGITRTEHFLARTSLEYYVILLLTVRPKGRVRAVT